MPKRTEKLNAEGEVWFTFRLDKDMNEKLKMLAEREERSISHQIRYLLKEALSKSK